MHTQLNTVVLELVAKEDGIVRPIGQRQIASFAAVQADGSPAYPHESRYEVETWRKELFEAIIEVRSGDTVIASGALRVEDWKDRQGALRTTVKVVVSSLVVVNRQKGEAPGHVFRPRREDDVVGRTDTHTRM